MVVALTFVASPFYLRQAQASFGALDRSWLDASRTLGASPSADVPAHRDPDRRAGARDRRRARLRPGARRVRRHAHVRRLAGRASPKPRRSRSSSASRPTSTAALALSAVLVAVSAAILLGGQARRAAMLSARLRAELRSPLSTGSATSSSTSRSRSRAGECVALAGPSGAGKTQRAAYRRRPRARRARAASRAATRVWLDTERGVDLPPERAAAATCSRTTRCSRT